MNPQLKRFWVVGCGKDDEALGLKEEGKTMTREREMMGHSYYGVCALGGMFSAGTTHVLITPLDVLKVNMQVNPVKYGTIPSCFTSLLRERGPSVFWRGWGVKLFGYGVHGGCRFGLYEYFKDLYSNVLPHCNRNFVFFLSSASAEVFANLALCPFEAIKVQVQAQQGFAKGLKDGFPKIYASQGIFGFYRGLIPLLGRNLPFSMVMFSTFEHSVNFIYRNIIQKEKEECSKVQQLGVTCLAGYTAGSVGSVITNPSDLIVSALYNKKADTIMQVVRGTGIWDLFTRSLPVRILLVGPSVTLQWFFYDTIKVLNGWSTSGGRRRSQQTEVDK
ncbi:PREDICTED: mitochondrial phosphate carrier protein 1, mitochondrial-like isoform X2 [Tarenaya hassleriana]|uniref:mitochondrial phosphate carrier protein 1, mitochondrial-like isoform X2 n=1 Tax=Tarenaya hassleriana TaxID=28532 RepID=UPI00053C099D|nr:PREDICTED: mitochondrial phosphate carrier protein 1, mitochondrial-like isoform X2 [Tarenaya hassleriana]